MKYLYEVVDYGSTRVFDIIDRWDVNYNLPTIGYIRVTNQLTNEIAFIMSDKAAMIEWNEMLGREESWYKQIPLKENMQTVEATKELVKESPTEFKQNYNVVGKASHYQDIIPGMQYQDVMCYLLKDKDPVEASLLTQVYKYLMRSGKKDSVAQEYKKALWYFRYLVAYMTANRAIKAEEVDTILGTATREEVGEAFNEGTKHSGDEGEYWKSIAEALGKMLGADIVTERHILTVGSNKLTQKQYYEMCYLINPNVSKEMGYPK